MANFAVFRDESGQWRWRFTADNHRIIASSSESYRDRADCVHAIRLVREEGPKATVVDTSSEPHQPVTGV